MCVFLSTDKDDFTTVLTTVTTEKLVETTGSVEDTITLYCILIFCSLLKVVICCK